MRRTIIAAIVLLAVGCGPVKPPAPPSPPKPTRQVRASFMAAGPYDRDTWPTAQVTLEMDPPYGVLPCQLDPPGNGYFTCPLNADTPVPYGAHLHVRVNGYLPWDADVILKTEPDFKNGLVWWQFVPGPDDAPNVGNPKTQVLIPAAPPMPHVPTKSELMKAQYTFQGLRANCPQYDPRPIPIFDPMMDVVDRDCQLEILRAHRAAGDKIIGVAISHKYGEPGIIQILAAGHDWTGDLPGLHAYLVDLIQQGFYIQLHLAMDGHSIRGPDGRYTYNDPVGNTYGCEWGAEFFPTLADALDDIHRYIRFLPGYDGVFYGCEDDGLPIKIPAFARQFKARWPDGVLGIEPNTGHLPFGEGDADWQPGGRMSLFDMVFMEFDGDLNQDSTWQIIPRLMKQKGQYHRPPEQPAGDDPDPPAYLGKWPGEVVCFEWDTYDDVRFKTTPQSVEVKRQKLRAMGCPNVG